MLLHSRASTKGWNLASSTEVFKTGFYKGTFRAQTGTIVYSRNYLVLFRPYENVLHVPLTLHK